LKSLYNSCTYIEDLNDSLRGVGGIERLKNSRILITGATGLIGSYIVDMLLQYNKNENAGITVYALGRNTNRLEERFSGIKSESLVFVEHDVNTEPSFDFAVDYIIHAASNAYPAVFNTDPVGTVLSNIVGTNYLLEYAKKHSAKRFLFVSSGEVYGQGEEGIEAFREDYSGYVDPTQPRSCYPASKRAAETLCVSYTKQYAVDTVIVRPCHTYGPSATKSDNRANTQFISSAVAGEDIVLNSAGTQMRSYCYIGDCAAALLTVLLDGKSCEAYNIANKEARTTIAGFAKTVAEAAGRKVIFKNPDDRDLAERTAISYAVLDSGKLSSLGWEGRYSVENGVENTVRILKEI
jgi:nucleoside-diphosphate-sugar epimerase